MGDDGILPVAQRGRNGFDFGAGIRGDPPIPAESEGYGGFAVACLGGDLPYGDAFFLHLDCPVRFA